MATAVQSVERAFAILDALRAGPSNLSDVSRRVGLPISTTSRLLTTLEGVEAVERLDNMNLYRVGPGIVTIASGVDVNRSLAALAADELRDLAKVSGEAVGLSVTSGYFIHFIAEERPETTVQLKDWVDARLPMHLVASGFVALAAWPDEAIDNYLERDLQAPTDKSLADPESVWKRIAEVRQSGIAWTHDELEMGMTSLAAPLIASSGEVVGAVHIHGPSFRYPGGQVARFEKLVRASAERINLLLT